MPFLQDKADHLLTKQVVGEGVGGRCTVEADVVPGLEAGTVGGVVSDAVVGNLGGVETSKLFVGGVGSAVDGQGVLDDLQDIQGRRGSKGARKRGRVSERWVVDVGAQKDRAGGTGEVGG